MYEHRGQTVITLGRLREGKEQQCRRLKLSGTRPEAVWEIVRFSPVKSCHPTNQAGAHSPCDSLDTPDRGAFESLRRPGLHPGTARSLDFLASAAAYRNSARTAASAPDSAKSARCAPMIHSHISACPAGKQHPNLPSCNFHPGRGHMTPTSIYPSDSTRKVCETSKSEMSRL